MSWQSYCVSTKPNYFESTKESNRFGIGVARLDIPAKAPSESSWEYAVDQINSSDAEVVVMRYPSVHSSWFSKLRSTGRDLIFADSMTYWYAPISEIKTDSFDVSPFHAEWGSTVDDELRSLIRETFTGFSNHYAANPLFDQSKAAEGYIEWTESVATEGLLVVLRDEGGSVVGYRATSFVGGVWDGIVGGTSPSARGSGAFKKALQSSVLQAIAKGAEAVSVSTQAQNIATQRTYAKYFSLLPHAAFTTVHLVKRGLLPD